VASMNIYTTSLLVLILYGSSAAAHAIVPAVDTRLFKLQVRSYSPWVRRCLTIQDVAAGLAFVAFKSTQRPLQDMMS
jgi:hypothetical protein